MEERACRHRRRRACRRGLDVWRYTTWLERVLRRHDSAVAARCHTALVLNVFGEWKSLQRLNTRLGRRLREMMGRCEALAFGAWRQVALLPMVPVHVCSEIYASLVSPGLEATPCQPPCRVAVPVEMRARLYHARVERECQPLDRLAYSTRESGREQSNKRVGATRCGVCFFGTSIDLRLQVRGVACRWGRPAHPARTFAYDTNAMQRAALASWRQHAQAVRKLREKTKHLVQVLFPPRPSASPDAAAAAPCRLNCSLSAPSPASFPCVDSACLPVVARRKRLHAQAAIVDQGRSPRLRARAALPPWCVCREPDCMRVTATAQWVEEKRCGEHLLTGRPPNARGSSRCCGWCAPASATASIAGALAPMRCGPTKPSRKRSSSGERARRPRGSSSL